MIKPETKPAPNPATNQATNPVNSTDIPEWALWLAQDASGDWWAFEAEPNQGDIAWYENEVGRYLRIGTDQKNPDWKATLKKR